MTSGEEKVYVFILSLYSSEYTCFIFFSSFYLLFSCLFIKQVYGISLAFMLVGAVVSAMSSSTLKGMNVVTMLSIWRFVLGVGK